MEADDQNYRPPPRQHTMDVSDLSAPPDATTSEKEWIDADRLASPEFGIDFVLAYVTPPLPMTTKLNPVPQSSVERPCMPHINVPGHESHVPITGHALMASSSLLSFAPSPSTTRSPRSSFANVHATHPPAQPTPPAQATFMSQPAAWTLPRQEIGRLLELSSRLDLVGHITPVEAWNRVCLRCRPRGISRRAFEELEAELVGNAECHGYVGWSPLFLV